MTLMKMMEGQRKAYNKWTESRFPRTYAGIHLVPGEQRLARDGYTAAWLLNRVYTLC